MTSTPTKYVDVSSIARGLNFGSSLYLQPYSLYTNSTVWSDSLLLDNTISNKILYAGPFILCFSKILNFRN